MTNSAPSTDLHSVTGARSRTRRLVDLFINPHPSLASKEQCREARVLAGFLLILLVLTIAGLGIPAVFRMTDLRGDPFTIIMTGTAVGVAVAYGLSRTRSYKLGAGLTAFLLSVLPYTLATSRQDFSPERVPSVFGWLVLPLLLGSIFLGWRSVLLLAGANILGLALFPQLVHQVTFQALFPAFSLVIVASSLILLAVHNRGRVEKIRLADLTERNLELQSLRLSLEQHIEERTRNLEKRLAQIRSAAEILRSMNTILHPQELLQQVVNLVRERFDLYYVGIFLLDEKGTSAVLQAGTGEPGAAMIADGHRLSVGGTSMVGWATANRQPRIALDVGEDAVRFDNPHLPLTRSEMALPLLTGEQMIGALTIQSSQKAAFDEDDIAVLQGIADGLATAIQNAQLFRQVQESLEEIRMLHRSYLTEAWSQPDLHAEELKASLDRTSPGEDFMETSELSAISVPLSLRDQVIGHLTLEADKSAWSPEETAFIEAVTTQAAIALENARLLDETRKRVARERVVAEITSNLWASTDLDSTLRSFIRELGRVMNASEAIIQLQVQD